MDKIYRHQSEHKRQSGTRWLEEESGLILDNLFADSALRKYARLSFEWADEPDPDIVEITFKIKWKVLRELLKTRKKSKPP